MPTIAILSGVLFLLHQRTGDAKTDSRILITPLVARRWRVSDTETASANEAGGHPGRASPSGRAGDHRPQASSKVVLAGRAPDVP
jgi:hypothetical protein